MCSQQSWLIAPQTSNHHHAYQRKTFRRGGKTRRRNYHGRKWRKRNLSLWCLWSRWPHGKFCVLITKGRGQFGHSKSPHLCRCTLTYVTAQGMLCARTHSLPPRKSSSWNDHMALQPIRALQILKWKTISALGLNLRRKEHFHSRRKCLYFLMIWLKKKKWVKVD